MIFYTQDILGGVSLTGSNEKTMHFEPTVDILILNEEVKVLAIRDSLIEETELPLLTNFLKALRYNIHSFLELKTREEYEVFLKIKLSESLVLFSKEEVSIILSIFPLDCFRIARYVKRRYKEGIN